MGRRDVVVVGGGAAGLSAAVALGRSRRDVLVIDAGSPRNAPAEGVHNLLGHDGLPPLELVARGREEVRRYGGTVVTAEAVSARAVDDGFEVDLDDGTTVAARRLIVTTGLVDELPDIPGLRERWGRDVLHCPYCHGWEVRDRPIGVVATGPMSAHQALLFRQLSDDVVFFRHTGPAPTPEEEARLAARGVTMVEGEVVAVEVAGDALTGVRLADGRVVARSAVVVAPRFVARSAVLEGLGLHPVEHPSGIGSHIPAGVGGRTDVPGVWVAGNVTDLSAHVVTSAAAGVMAGAMVNADLVTEDADRAQPTLV